MPKTFFTSKMKADYCPRHGTSSTSSTSFSTAACPDSPLEGSSCAGRSLVEMAKYNGNFGVLTVDGTTSCANWYSVKLMYISIAGHFLNINQPVQDFVHNKSNRPSTVILQTADPVGKGPWRHFLCSICLCLDDDLRDTVDG